MIINFSCQETQKIWQGIKSLRLPHDIQPVARRKLRMMNNAKCLTDLRLPPNNRLEALKGDREGLFSIRINKQWRICFKWDNNNAYDIIIEDYHS
jgi:proteic killer suppression protein